MLEFNCLAYQAKFKVTDVKFLDWYPKGKRKLGILEPLLRFVPQISASHVMFRLKPILKLDR